MRISIVSSLTPEDERRCAAVFFRAACSLLDLLPIAYTIQVTTTAGKSFNRTRAPLVDSDDTPSRLLADLADAQDQPQTGDLGRQRGRLPRSH
jgi:hypothetical protein